MGPRGPRLPWFSLVLERGCTNGYIVGPKLANHVCHPCFRPTLGENQVFAIKSFCFGRSVPNWSSRMLSSSVFQRHYHTILPSNVLL